MKKVFTICIFIFVCVWNCFSQIINSDYFPKDNEIDKQYEVDMQKWTTNYEWQEINGKYQELWKKQMYLELERLISIIPKSESIIRANQKKWEDSIKSDYSLVRNNVNMNFIGREIYIGEFDGNWISLYKERAKYYLCLYYTILDQTSEDLCYTDRYGTKLAK